MKPSEYAAVFAAEQSHWWYIGMQAISEALLRQVYPAQSDLRILDAGCGTGGSMIYLGQFGRVTGCDYSPYALAYCQRRQLKRLSRAGVEALPFIDESFDLVASIDVLYHETVTDYHRALREFHRVLKPGGRVFLRLPAYDWLRGYHDVIIETARRFTTGDLRAALVSSGFRPEKLSYANTMLFPLALAKRMTERLVPPQLETSDVYHVHRWVNRVCTACLKSEARWLARGNNFPFGLTALALARKE
jgi:SAM-dependent methyltransferase